MAELLEEQRENWGTRGGFVLAAIGSAVGLGNLWGKAKPPQADKAEVQVTRR